MPTSFAIASWSVELLGSFKEGIKNDWWLFYNKSGEINHKCQLKNNKKDEKIKKKNKKTDKKNQNVKHD